MTQPHKILAFLDLFGSWDPSLLFVMCGAIGVHFITYRLIRRRKSPLLSRHWHLPKKDNLTPSLIVGAFIFGIGWGLGGYCPGPAVTALASLQVRPVLFVLSMIAGMGLWQAINRKIH
jgi:uncharacterized membrane protein YedE/YeeE